MTQKHLGLQMLPVAALILDDARQLHWEIDFGLISGKRMRGWE